MMAQGAEASEPMLSRSLLVHDGITLRRLDSTSSLLILLPYEEHLQREAQLVENHHVVFVVTDGDADIELPPLDHLALEAALLEAGFPRPSSPGTCALATRACSPSSGLPRGSDSPIPASGPDLSERVVVERGWQAPGTSCEAAT